MPFENSGRAGATKALFVMEGRGFLGRDSLAFFYCDDLVGGDVF
jgi:hypothetical protein